MFKWHVIQDIRTLHEPLCAICVGPISTKAAKGSTSTWWHQSLPINLGMDMNGHEWIVLYVYVWWIVWFMYRVQLLVAQDVSVLLLHETRSLLLGLASSVLNLCIDASIWGMAKAVGCWCSRAGLLQQPMPGRWCQGAYKEQATSISGLYGC